LKKSTIAIFVVFALIFAVVIPYIAIRKEGEGDPAVAQVPAADEDARDLFQTNCGSCHTLAAAGTDGVVGPNLDKLLGMGSPEANQPRVEAAVKGGIEGRMPKGILSGEQLTEVADFVAREAGQ
jgi:mono/diheme cytochrome c family protein